MHRKVESVFELYAVALAIGQRFAQQYRDAAGQLRAAGDNNAADLLETIEDMECALALQIDRWSCGARLPQVDLQQYFAFGEPRLSVTTRRDIVLESAIAAERMVRTRYTQLAGESSDEEVRALAAALASERDRHVWRVRRILSRPAMSYPTAGPLAGALALAAS